MEKLLRNEEVIPCKSKMGSDSSAQETSFLSLDAQFIQPSASDGMPVCLAKKDTASPASGCCSPKKSPGRQAEQPLQHPEQPRVSLPEPSPSRAVKRNIVKKNIE